jgi:hypothetical protein
MRVVPGKRPKYQPFLGHFIGTYSHPLQRNSQGQLTCILEAAMAVAVSRMRRHTHISRLRSRHRRKTPKQSGTIARLEDGWGHKIDLSETTTAPAIEAREPSPPEEQSCTAHEQSSSRYETLVPMRGMDEWALWSYLEKIFGDDAHFSVVVS